MRTGVLGERVSRVKTDLLVRVNVICGGRVFRVRASVIGEEGHSV